MSKITGVAIPKSNYKYIIAGIVVVLIGFFLMSGGGADNPNVFQEEELFSARRITLAPFLVILGYGTILWAIMKKTDEDKTTLKEDPNVELANSEVIDDK